MRKSQTEREGLQPDCNMRVAMFSLERKFAATHHDQEDAHAFLAWSGTEALHRHAIHQTAPRNKALKIN